MVASADALLGCADAAAADGIPLRRQGFADFEWGSLIGEFDGQGKYGGTDAERAAALEAEKQRHALFVAAGFEVVRWNWPDLLNDSLLRSKLTPALARHGLLAA